MGESDYWDTSWGLVVIRSIGMGWLLGMGPSRKRVISSLVDRNSFHPFCARSRTTRNVTGLEFVAPVNNLCVDNLWHLLDPFGSH